MLLNMAATWEARWPCHGKRSSQRKAASKRISGAECDCLPDYPRRLRGLGSLTRPACFAFMEAKNPRNLLANACLDDRACRRRNVAFKRSRLEVITRPKEFAGHRIEIAYDAHTGTEAAASTK
jgi:hypothetical protein